MKFDVLKRQVGRFKNSEEGRRIMCKAMERIAACAEAHGEARGEARGKREAMLVERMKLGETRV